MDEKAFNVVSKEMSEVYYPSLEGYIDTNPSVRYKRVRKDKLFYEKLKTDDYLREGQILLEELSSVRFKARMMADLSSYFIENDISYIIEHNKY